jgi:hypothetical protein
MLADRYPDEGPIRLALETGRSEDSVSSFAHRCGLRTRRWLERRHSGQFATDQHWFGEQTVEAVQG